MRLLRPWMLLGLLLFSSVGTASAQQTATPTPMPQATATSAAAATATLQPTPEVTYTVQPGDTLFRIARRFNTTVRLLAEANGITNTSLIYVGQRLRIPGAVQTPTPVSPTPLPSGETTTYVVQRGDTLFRIATRFGTTVGAILRANNLANGNIIYVGQRLTIPTATPTTAAPAVAATSTTTAIPTQAAATTTLVPTVPASPTAAALGTATQTIGEAQSVTAETQVALGIEAFFEGQDPADIASQIVELGGTWAKVDVSWRDIEPVQGEINLTPLAGILDALQSSGLQVLVTVYAAPDWARGSLDESGPPDDFATFATFTTALSTELGDRIDAYEIWNTPNLRRAWNSPAHPIGAASYLELLRTAYAAIKAADPRAVVISGGLSPTGFNDGINAINDRIFLRDLYNLGGAEFFDAVGAHPAGYANPPDARCCEPSAGVTTHFEDRSFYFLDTLEDYRQIMTASGDTATQIWVTRFGWGTSEDTPAPSANNVFYTYTSLEEQAAYSPRALNLSRELGYVGAMFLSNLNGCTARPNDVEACYTSLFGPDGAPRPLYAALSLEAEAGGR